MDIKDRGIPMKRIFICVLSVDGKASQFDRFFWELLDAQDAKERMPRCKLIWLEQKADISTLTRLSTDTMVWYSPNNLGCAGGRQRLIDYLITSEKLGTKDLVFFLDDDIQFIGKEWLWHFLKASADYDVIGQEGRVIGADGNSYPHEGKPIEYLSGGWCMWKGYVLLDPKVNMDTAYSIYFEDSDLCYQARQAGYTLGEVNSPHLQHVSHVTPEKSVAYQQGRNRFLSKWRSL